MHIINKEISNPTRTAAKFIAFIAAPPVYGSGGEATVVTLGLVLELKLGGQVVLLLRPTSNLESSQS